MMPGIPYAKSEERAGKWGKVCPICGEWIETIERKDFESFTGTEYADHYAAQHSEPLMTRSRELNDIMEFDHVIEVHEGGTVTDGPRSLYAPSLYDGELDDKSWTMLDGYSGQDRYAGPIMHNSEFIGGLMERDILERPGYYVALVGFWPTEDEDEEDNVEGWAVAYKEKP